MKRLLMVLFLICVMKQRDIDQNISSQKKIDEWFEAKTRGLSRLAKTQLKQKWGTMQKVFQVNLVYSKS
jgi:hypothetical protein